MNAVLMVILTTVIYNGYPAVAQTTTETTAVACATAKQSLVGENVDEAPAGATLLEASTRLRTVRKIDCIPVRP